MAHKSGQYHVPAAGRWHLSSQEPKRFPSRDRNNTDLSFRETAWQAPWQNPQHSAQHDRLWARKNTGPKQCTRSHNLQAPPVDHGDKPVSEVDECIVHALGGQRHGDTVNMKFRRTTAGSCIRCPPPKASRLDLANQSMRCLLLLEKLRHIAHMRTFSVRATGPCRQGPAPPHTFGGTALSLSGSTGRASQSQTGTVSRSRRNKDAAMRPSPQPV